MQEAITPAANVEFYIAIGKSRKDITFKNVAITWSKLIEKLSVTKRTTETIAEYLSYPKDRQDKIKDIGGFVGGTLKDGRRKASNVQSRCLLTLDIDFIANVDDLLFNLDLLFGTAAAFYTTHKHQPDSPRGRLVLLLSRPVLPDEYQAIGRFVADKLGIEQFDDTTYDVNRLMYWPSTSKDGEYRFEELEGPALDADQILATYPDWRDSSYWPQSNRETSNRLKLADKQGNPLDKKGMLGLFCRTYSIHEAIDQFLSDIYEQTHDSSRYTYVNGSTAGGLVVYDDGLFAYSNHATDPISGKLVNSFDLVRIHRFGHLDSDADERTPINRKPSFLEMERFVNADERVREQMIQERTELARDDFPVENVPEESKADTAWMKKLETHHKTGKCLSTSKNIKLILLNDERLKGAMAYNEFNYRYVVLRDLPWRNVDPGTAWTDTDESCLRNYLEAIYGIDNKSKIQDALNEVFNINKFHPVRNYLNGLVWDGIERIETMLIDYLGAEDNEYIRTVTRKTMLGGVARIFNPGIKFDTMLVLVGRQGEGKSTLFAKLGGKWFSDSLTGMHGKESYEQLVGKWIVEVAELAASKRSEVESQRNFISKTTDSFRAAYARHAADYARQNIFVGTTNEDRFLKDVAGNRRFWPVTIGMQEKQLSVFNDLTDEIVGQLWAEAVERYRTEKDLHLNERLVKMAEEVQEQHFDESPRFGIVQDYLDRLLPTNWDVLEPRDRYEWLHNPSKISDGILVRERVCPIAIWCECFGGDPKIFPKTDIYDINNIMKKMPGWNSHQGANGRSKFSKYGLQTSFVRVNNRYQ